MATSKIETFIGFCVKSRNITYGGDSIGTLKGGVFALLMCSTAAKNTLKLALKYREKFNCPLVVCYCGLENAVNKTGCKLAAVRDKNLAKAITDNLDGNYKLYAEAVNG